MVPMPRACCAAAAAIASSSRSPGMKVDTERRTNAVFVARSRSQRVGGHREERFAGERSQQSLDQAAIHLQRGAGDVRRGLESRNAPSAAEIVRLAVAADRNGGRALPAVPQA